MKRHLTIFLLLLLFVFFLPIKILAGTITSPHYYAWSNNVGWINFKDTIVSDSTVTGYAWSSNNGWIKMNPSNGGVINDGQGNLSGYAWGEGFGWMNFSGVSITSGVFSGTATGDNIGTLTFDCANCDVQTDWRPAPPQGGGGGGDTTPPPDEDPPPEEEIQNQPSGSVQINNGAQYSNSPIVNLQFVTDYVDSYSISNNNDFSSASYLSIVSSTNFSLSTGDGSKTVYVSFKNQYGTYVASDSIILDTIAPNPPNIAQIDNGVVNGVAVRPPSISGTSEANTQIIISKVKEGAQAAGFFSLADATTYYTTANSQGNWSFTFATLFESGNYAISVKAQDSAGNISLVSATKYVLIPETTEIPPEEIPPEENPPEETPPPEENLPGEENGQNTTETDNNGGTTTDTTESGETIVVTSSTENNFSTSTVTSTIPQFIVENVTKVVEEVKNQVIDVSKNVSETVQQTSKKLAETVKVVTDKIAEVLNNPEVDNVNKTIATPVITTVTVVSLASSGFGFVNIVNLFRVFFGQFFLVFRRKKQKKWGVLYNSFTKKPIDLASVRLIDLQTNRIVRSVVTDTDGRYVLSAEPGNYKIQITKNGYSGFSKYLKDLTEDSAFINLYHGENIQVTDASEINYNIPFDPIENDRSYLQIIKDKSHKAVRVFLSTFGLAFSIISFIITPVWWVGALVIFQFFLYFTVRHFSYHKLPASFGVITAHDEEKALPNVAVRVFDASFNKLVETTVSDRKGRYAVLLGPNKYYVTYEKEKYEIKKSPLLDFSSKNNDSQGGILVRDETLEGKILNKKV